MANPSPDHVRALFHEAIRKPPDSRMEFLREACRDDVPLFERVAALLDSDRGTTVAGSGHELDSYSTLYNPPTEFRGTDRFLVQRRIGAGSFGVVYEVRDRLKGNRVALKTLQNVTSESLYRFKREFRSLAEVSHRNLVQLYELASSDEHWFFTMELVQGQQFLDYVRDGGSLVPAASQLAEGLDALHRSGHFHRDVKPANVLVTGEGRVVLLDFGLIVEVEGEAAQQSLMIAGTPAYMSPEQAAGLPLTAASDLYSVGVMLYEALTGAPPFEGSYLQVLTEKQRADPAAPSSRLSGIPSHLDALCADLLKRDPASRPTVADVLARLHVADAAVQRPAPKRSRERSQPFVGRKGQLFELRRALGQMLSGTPVLATVSGPSGIGKSALVKAFLDEVARDQPNAVILSGRCYERESVPYKALDSLVDALARYLKSLPVHEANALLPREIGALAQLFPLLREFQARLPQRGGEPRDAQELRRRAYAGLRELLARLGDRRPLVMFIDDLQWGDVDSAGLLAETLRVPDAPVLLLIAAYRDVEIETSPFLRTFLNSDAIAGASSVPLRVDPLDPGEAQELAAALLKSPSVAAHDIVSVIASESGGSPFFIDELVRFAEMRADEFSGDREDRHAAGTDEREATLSHMVQIRLSRLPPAAQQLLRLVAVNGRPLPEYVLRSAAEDVSDSDLAMLRSEHLLRARETERGVELEPYHDRIREIVVRSLEPEVLRQCHGELALALEAHSTPDAELLAEHFSGAGDAPRAARYTVLAAHLAEQALAFDRAARLYTGALDLLPDGSPDRAACMSSLGTALSNAGRCAEAATVYLAVPAASTAEALDFKQKAAQQLLFAGHIDEGLAVVREVLRSIGMSLPETRRQTVAELLAGRVRVRLRGLRYTERTVGEMAADELMKVDACWSVSAGLSVIDTMRGAVFQTRHLLLALKTGELSRVHRALGMEAVFAVTGGPGGIARSQRILQLTRGLTPRVGTPYAAAMQLLTEGVSDYLVGKWSTAGAAVSEAERILTEHCTGVTWELDGARFFGLCVLNELGELKAISERFPILLKDANDRGDLYAGTTIGVLAHVSYLAAADPDAASRYTDDAIRRWAQKGFHMPHLWELWSSVDIAIYQGRGIEAYERVQRTWPDLERSLLLKVLFTRISMLNLKGRAALSAGCSAATAQHRDPFCRTALECATALERQHLPWADALALMLRAGVQQLRGETGAAIELFTGAETAFTPLDMRLLLAVARRRRGELIGGAGGRDLVTRSEEWMRSQDIRDPSAFARMFSPAPEGSSSSIETVDSPRL